MAKRRMRMEPVYVKRRQRGLAVLIASLFLIVASIAYISWRMLEGSTGTVTDSYDYRTDGNGVVEMVEISEGDTMASLAPELAERDIVASERAFVVAASASPEASNIQPGFYRLQGQMSAKAAVAALLNPASKVDLLDVYGGATLHDVHVVGGDVRLGIYSMISRVTTQDGQPGVSVEELERVAATVDPAQLGVADWAQEPVRARGNDPRRIEGLIAPGQYVMDPAKSAQEILTDLITRSAQSYNDTGIVARAQAMGLSPYELLTAASLVEREAPAGEFDKVARVILNRLQLPMRLEFDSTVNYGLDQVEVATTDEDRQRITPWNTYAMDGLPQTPIASPSLQSIEAVENPAEGEWLFFVTIDKDGTTVFNNTFEEHQQDVVRALESGVLDSQRQQ